MIFLTEEIVYDCVTRTGFKADPYPEVLGQRVIFVEQRSRVMEDGSVVKYFVLPSYVCIIDGYNKLNAAKFKYDFKREVVKVSDELDCSHVSFKQFEKQRVKLKLYNNHRLELFG